MVASMSESNVWQLHDAACAAGQDGYVDPATGYLTFTRDYLQRRGRCCAAGCRHCPFAHSNIPVEARPAKIKQAAWLTYAYVDPEPASLLFWSGGKDSYLAYLDLQRRQRHTVLLTTFDAQSGVIAHQGLHIDDVIQQALALSLPLIGVPLHSDKDYVDHILPALTLSPQVNELVFGDLHLVHIRNWREQTFGAHPDIQGFSLAFPLWQVDYEALFKQLALSPISITISATVPDLAWAQGLSYDADFIARLPEGVDPFGENGEFHTHVKVDG